MLNVRVLSIEMSTDVPGDIYSSQELQEIQSHENMLKETQSEPQTLGLIINLGAQQLLNETPRAA